MNDVKNIKIAFNIARHNSHVQRLGYRSSPRREPRRRHARLSPGVSKSQSKVKMNVVEMLVRQGTGVFVRDCPSARSGFVHASLINALVPPQRILRRNRGGNVGGASRAHAVLALTAVRAAIVGAEESTAH